MGELVGDDPIEGGAIVHEQCPDVRVFISHVGEGIVENCSDSV